MKFATEEHSMMAKGNMDNLYMHRMRVFLGFKHNTGTLLATLKMLIVTTLAQT